MEPENSQEASPAGENQTDIKVLLLDTPENEGVDFLQSLNREGMKFDLERVDGRDDLFKALKDSAWDILLVNDQVTNPSLDETLSLLGQVKSDAGYVLLSKEALTIESLANSYQKNISEVVSSNHLAYSLEVFSRAAEKSRRNFQLSQLNQEKFELARHRDQLMSGTEEALAYLQDGIHVYGNNAYLSMLGYKDMDELAYMPFIDVVSTEMRDKVKQQFLDYQHKVRVKPETQALELSELFLTSIGDKEGVLEVQATLKPVVYDGEDCLQIVIKDKSEMAGKGDSVGEGLGYPLFVAHLDNFIAEAKLSGGKSGQVVHVSGKGFEHYIASKGFGSLNGKMKALASELKARLASNDQSIRFTENSFLVLIKGNEPEDVEKVTQIGEVLQKFEAALNKEIGNAKKEALVIFSHDEISVTAESASAEQLIKSFLVGADSETDGGGVEEAVKKDEAIVEKTVEKTVERPVEKPVEQTVEEKVDEKKEEVKIEAKEEIKVEQDQAQEAAVEKAEASEKAPIEQVAPSEPESSPAPEAAVEAGSTKAASGQSYEVTPDGVRRQTLLDKVSSDLRDTLAHLG
jgi:GGDEF domain-containing protein